MNETGIITFRSATIDDLETLQYWDTLDHVINAAPGSDWEWEEYLPQKPSWREQLIADLDGRPLGFVQIIDPQLEETHYWGDIGAHKRAIDIWIGEKEDLGQGYGTIMMNLALERCFGDPKVSEVLIDPLASNVRAIHFYRRIGFEFVEEREFDGDLCHVFTFTRENWENQLKNIAEP